MANMITRRRSFFGMIGFNGFCLLVIIVLVGVSTYVQYTKEDTVTATVLSITTQQSVSGTDGNVSTSYTYLVGTDKGTMQIQPDGIMSSTAFGQLKEGKTYRLHTRGFSFPLFGMYPYIVDAKEE
jgi:hypothetical protein